MYVWVWVGTCMWGHEHMSICKLELRVRCCPQSLCVGFEAGSSLNVELTDESWLAGREPQEPTLCLPSTKITSVALLDSAVSAGTGNSHPGAHACTAKALLLQLPPQP